MRRVCKPGGKIIVLNHFRSANPILSRLERAISPFTVHIGFKSDLDLPGFLAQAELQPISIEKVNVPKIWSLVTCIEVAGSRQRAWPSASSRRRHEKAVRGTRLFRSARCPLPAAG